MATGMSDVNLKTFREHPYYDEFWTELNPEAPESGGLSGLARA